ncbi:MAG: adenylate/guanylate cyclase domain-containing protein, partial [Chloroflexi bacterium]|nr:adenylate/guanylate cyclase domain-containing protein [Chloroflexota bacterium]
MTAPPPGGQLTFLFSDIEGSTRLEEALGTTAYGVLRERHREILRRAFAALGGAEQGTEGDSFFVVFPSARPAIEAAVAAQRAIAAEPWPAGAEVRVRMGIHSGEAELVGGSLVGLDINRAARIAGVAHGGQVLASESTRVLAGGLTGGTTLRDLGDHRLRDLRAPLRLHQVNAEGLVAEFPPLRSLDARPNNLPTQLTNFVGRESELAETRDLLARTRLLTLTGPGGTGKTRLSLQLAANVAEDYPDGVFFVPLEAVRDPALLDSVIGSTIGILDTGARPARDAVVEWLAAKRVLLVLDNFEQVLAGAPLVTDLLRAAEGLRVIVSSRSALRVAGEQEYPVPGLPVPPDTARLTAVELAQLPGELRHLSPASLAQYEAVRLFVMRALAVRPDFAVTNENAPAVAAICARLGGLPLAIELAAARVKLLSPDAILSRLEGQLSLLAAGARDLPERQQTLRGAIAWSYDLLDPGARRLLDRLAIFRGSFDLEAAEAIAGPAADLGTDVLDGLVALADQSLVRGEGMDGGDPRFRLLESIREFAGEMLDARAERATIAERHRDHYLALVERAAPELSGVDQRSWLERLEFEHDNVRAVLDHALTQPWPNEGVRAAFAMWRFWQKRGHLGEARRRLEALDTAPWSHDDRVLRARICEALGGVCYWQADFVTMGRYYEEAVELWRAEGNRAELANALYNYAFKFTIAPDPTRVVTDIDPEGLGLAALQEARTLFAELGDLRGEANTLWALGNGDYFRDVGDAGVGHYRDALAIFRRAGDRTMEAWSLHMLGSALLRRGAVDEGRAAMEHAMRHFWSAGDAAGMTLAFDDLSSVAVAD